MAVENVALKQGGGRGGGGGGGGAEEGWSLHRGSIAHTTSSVQNQSVPQKVYYKPSLEQKNKKTKRTKKGTPQYMCVARKRIQNRIFIIERIKQGTQNGIDQ